MMKLKLIYNKLARQALVDIKAEDLISGHSIVRDIHSISAHRYREWDLFYSTRTLLT